MFKLFFLTVIQCFGSGSVIGNGGDPIFEFLEAARSSTLETLNLVLNDKVEFDKFCSRSKVSPEQSQFCREFLRNAYPQILRLNQTSSKTEFVLREEPLLVEGPDGKPQPVAARTLLDKVSPIEFHRDTVKTSTPIQVMFLIAHEFQHKVEFQGRFISDNELMPPFASGRALLDTVAAALTEVARRRGIIGSQFGIRDILDCSVSTNENRFGARVSSARTFQAEDLMSYSVSFGKNPVDGSVYIPESPNSLLRLLVEIKEPNNCGDLVPERRTKIQIIRSLRQSDGSELQEVVESLSENRNPFCPHENPELKIATGNLTFACKYFGSEGTTTSPYSLKH